MKRFHVHLHVDDLRQNITFYSALFGQEPARTEGDYAKWMLQDPPVNFAISTRGSRPGLDHLGFQVESADELDALKSQAQKADLAMLDEGETTCCYARSDKYWITDPQGVAWEQFRTLDSIPVFNLPAKSPDAASACCSPAAAAVTGNATSAAADAACCAPARPAAATCGSGSAKAGSCC